MKFTVEVNLDDFFSEDNNVSFSEQITDDICSQVTQRIYSDWGGQINHGITEKIKATVSEQKEKVINELITNATTNDKIRKSQFTDTMITIEDYIHEELNNTYSVNSGFARELGSILERKSKEIMDALQKRYDTAFATQIIIKLNENKMLKDDIASLLLSDVN